MRKSFLTKAVVAVGVMVSAMALSSVCAFAGTLTYATPNDYNSTTDIYTTVDNHMYTYNFAAAAATKDTSTDTVSFIKNEDNTIDGFYGLDFKNATLQVNKEETDKVKLSGNGQHFDFTVATGYQASVVVNGVTGNNGTDNVSLVKGSSTVSGGTIENTTATWSNLSAGTYGINRVNSNLRITSVVVTISEASYSDGTVTYSLTGNTTGDSVSVTVDGNAISSGTTVTGGKEVVITAAPATGRYAVITANGTEIASGDSVTMNGNLVVDVTFVVLPSQLDITQSITWTAGTNNEIIKEYGKVASQDYYFYIDGSTGTLSDQRIYAHTSSKGPVKFHTGNFSGTASIVVNFQSSNSSKERTLYLNNTSIGSAKGSPVNSNATVLEPNTDYTLSGSDGLYLYSIAITVTPVSDSLEPIAGLTVNDDLTCSAEYAKVDGTHYLVLDFTKNNALAAANALTYSVTGKEDIPIDTLYTGVQFDADGKDAIGVDGHLYYAFKFEDNENTYTSVTATIGVAN